MCAASVLTHRQRAGDAAIGVTGSNLIHRQLGWRPRFDRIYSIIETAWAWHRQNPGEYTFQTLPLCMSPSPGAQLLN